MKVYKFFDKYGNKLIQKTYTLVGIKCALKSRYSWCDKYSHNLEVVEYELKEVRRLTVDEVKQLNTKDSNNKYLKLLDLVSTKSGLTIEFYDYNTGSVWIDHGSNSIEFNSLDEAIEIVSKY